MHKVNLVQLNGPCIPFHKSGQKRVVLSNRTLSSAPRMVNISSLPIPLVVEKQHSRNPALMLNRWAKLHFNHRPSWHQDQGLFLSRISRTFTGNNRNETAENRGIRISNGLIEDLQQLGALVRMQKRKSKELQA